MAGVRGGPYTGRNRGLSMKIIEIMTTVGRTVAPGASVAEAARLMSEAGVGLVPVVLDGSVLGVLTDRDIVVRGAAEGLDLAETKVRDLLTPGVVSCFADDEVEAAVELMVEHRIHRLVVLTREHRLAGLVSLSDIPAGSPGVYRVFEAAGRPDKWPASALADAELPDDEAESSMRGPGVSETGEPTPAAARARLNALIRDELSAAAIYQQALEKVGADPVGDELRRMEREHEEAAHVLSEPRLRRGEKVPRGPGLRGAWPRAKESAAWLFGAKAAIKVLAEREREDVRAYEAALRDDALDPEVKSLIRLKLLPLTQARLPVLDRVLEAVR